MACNPETLVAELGRQTGMTRFGIWRLCRRYRSVGFNAIYDVARSGRPREISALERMAIEQLACCKPTGVGLEMTHWSVRSLARIAKERSWCLISPIQRSRSSCVRQTCSPIAVGIGLPLP